MELQVIARLRSPYGSKFGVPRQSGLTPAVVSRLVFEPPFRSRDCLRGIEGFSHLWLIWQFSENADRGWSPTVRPPRLGGNERVGVFATRSPFRPNPLGLSCVRLLGVDWETPEGPVLRLGGADLTDGTPVYDIKPYLPYADSIPEAVKAALSPEEWEALAETLAWDPRPSYQRDPERVYGFPFGGREVRFRVSKEEEIQVLSIGEKKGETR